MHPRPRPRQKPRLAYHPLPGFSLTKEPKRRQNPGRAVAYDADCAEHHYLRILRLKLLANGDLHHIRRRAPLRAWFSCPKVT